MLNRLELSACIISGHQLYHTLGTIGFYISLSSGSHSGEWAMLARLGRCESFDISPPFIWGFVSPPKI
jgi:hypothetical protein